MNSSEQSGANSARIVNKFQKTRKKVEFQKIFDFYKNVKCDKLL